MKRWRNFAMRCDTHRRQPEMHFSLAAALASIGRTSDAEFEFREALRLRPEFPEARHALDELQKLRK